MLSRESMVLDATDALEQRHFYQSSKPVADRKHRNWGDYIKEEQRQNQTVASVRQRGLPR
ncbi:MAG: hypothetical protein IPI37_04750 [Bacteroidales bacterium]|nr:hypothetical protein [Bacteroidales bacterium]